MLQDGCSSFDIALEVGKKIKSLQVATCGASSEKDKKLDTKILQPNPHILFLMKFQSPFLKASWRES